MNASDGSASRSDELKAVHARFASAEASVTSAKRDAKAAKNKRKEAKEVERRARKRLRRAKKELREAKRLLAEAEKSRPRPSRPRRLKAIEPVKSQAPAPAPPRIVRAKKKPRKRAIPALKPNRSRRSPSVTPPVETNSEPPVVEPATVTPSESIPPTPNA